MTAFGHYYGSGLGQGRADCLENRGMNWRGIRPRHQQHWHFQGADFLFFDQREFVVRERKAAGSAHILHSAHQYFGRHIAWFLADNAAGQNASAFLVVPQFKGATRGQLSVFFKFANDRSAFFTGFGIRHHRSFDGDKRAHPIRGSNCGRQRGETTVRASDKNGLFKSQSVHQQQEIFGINQRAMIPCPKFVWVRMAVAPTIRNAVVGRSESVPLRCPCAIISHRAVYENQSRASSCTDVIQYSAVTKRDGDGV